MCYNCITVKNKQIWRKVLEKEQFIQEIKFFLIRSLFLNISAYLISVFFIGFTFSMIVGLVMGTVGMIVNLILLNKSVRSIVNGGGYNAQSRMFTGYLIRLAITGAVVVVAMFVPFANVAGAVIPYFYPKLVYAGIVSWKKGEKPNESV